MELSGQYSLLSGPHHDMLLRLLLARHGLASGMAELAVGRLMVQQSVVAAVAEFYVQPVNSQPPLAPALTPFVGRAVPEGTRSTNTMTR